MFTVIATNSILNADSLLLKKTLQIVIMRTVSRMILYFRAQGSHVVPGVRYNGTGMETRGILGPMAAIVLPLRQKLRLSVRF